MYKNYVLDTNVLIENPQCIRALRNGQENRIILPYTVLCELDRLKREPRVAHIVAQAVTVLQNDPDIQFLPPRVFPDDDTRTNDDRILDELKDSRVPEPVLVTNDRILQLKARIHAIASEGYRDSNPFRSESQTYTGFVREGEEPAPNSFCWVNGQPYMHATSGPHCIDYQHCVWNVRPRNVYQNLALELMLDAAVHLVTIQSEAGYGKTFLALAAALYLALEEKDNPFRKIYLVKPVIEIGAKLGYLPGDLDEKMAPYVRYVQDLLMKLHDLRPANRIFHDSEGGNFRYNSKRFEILPIAYIRGMNLENAVVIIDEMQNLSRAETRALLTRMGENVKCICLGDTRQVDNPYLNESNNGLNWAVKMLKGLPGYGH
ncbi:MAG: phosphate starvation-inducible protein PhoH, partial [Deltaproteobacteria bacterium]|nr:phosphate starvation-inducible protein PhoH [Deltaproteobacteria bacterium]